MKSVQSTPALRTPRYYGHSAITDSSKIPGERFRLKQTPAITDSRYYGLTDTLFGPNVTILLSVFPLVIADTEQHLGIFAHISSLFFSAF